MRIIATVTLEYKGKKYIVKESYDPSYINAGEIKDDWEYGMVPDPGDEGDCGDIAKSQLIRSQCDPNFPEMCAGVEIKLVKLELERINKITYNYKTTLISPKGKEK